MAKNYAFAALFLLLLVGLFGGELSRPSDPATESAADETVAVESAPESLAPPPINQPPVPENFVFGEPMVDASQPDMDLEAENLDDATEPLNENVTVIQRTPRPAPPRRSPGQRLGETRNTIIGPDGETVKLVRKGG